MLSLGVVGGLAVVPISKCLLEHVGLEKTWVASLARKWSGLINRVDFPAVEDTEVPVPGSTAWDFGSSWKLYSGPQQTLVSSITTALEFSFSRATRSKCLLL